MLTREEYNKLRKKERENPDILSDQEKEEIEAYEVDWDKKHPITEEERKVLWKFLQNVCSYCLGEISEKELENCL